MKKMRPRRRARRAAVRREDGGAGDHEVRQRLAEAAYYLPRILDCDRLVVPGLFRTRVRLRPGIAQDQGRARVRDHYIVNGQKTWTTLGQHADWIFCLVRTDHERRSRRASPSC
jgi:alkylation response protein AidB-like acyl-CoA dehydrogenase